MPFDMTNRSPFMIFDPTVLANMFCNADNTRISVYMYNLFLLPKAVFHGLSLYLHWLSSDGLRLMCIVICDIFFFRVLLDNDIHIHFLVSSWQWNQKKWRRTEYCALSQPWTVMDAVAHTPHKRLCLAVRQQSITVHTIPAGAATAVASMTSLIKALELCLLS